MNNAPRIESQNCQNFSDLWKKNSLPVNEKIATSFLCLHNPPLSLPQSTFSRSLRSTICNPGHPHPMRTLWITSGGPERAKKRSLAESERCCSHRYGNKNIWRRSSWVCAAYCLHHGADMSQADAKVCAAANGMQTVTSESVDSEILSLTDKVRNFNASVNSKLYSCFPYGGQIWFRTVIFCLLNSSTESSEKEVVSLKFLCAPTEKNYDRP